MTSRKPHTREHDVTELRRRTVAKLAKFATVGGIAFVTDVGLFNVLLFLSVESVPAKFMSASVAVFVSFLLNRRWVFRAHDGNKWSQGVMFVAVNVIGLLIAVTCLAFTHHVLGFTSPLMDNISANVIGTALGMIFRFWMYNTVVFNNRETVTPE
jgi:putative flippase GtrA